MKSTVHSAAFGVEVVLAVVRVSFVGGRSFDLSSVLDFIFRFP